jgi:hypothetical protein
MTNKDTKRTEKQQTIAPNTDPKRRVQTIDLEQLEDVIGGNSEAGGPLRMATEE